jgi:D-alanyl-D-alanine carboxypeptidase/D-alanyl-D-alanine-endopeptidase (penicillin-binding protein 4)
LTIQNYVTTRKKGTGADRYYDRAMHSRVVKVEGGVDLGVKRRADYASVDNPTRYFATVFTELLERAGVEVVGGPADIDDFEDKTVFKRLRRRIASYQSPPMSELIYVINKRSQNFYAEQVLRTIGLRAKGVGGIRPGVRRSRNSFARTASTRAASTWKTARDSDGPIAPVRKPWRNC